MSTRDMCASHSREAHTCASIPEPGSLPAKIAQRHDADKVMHHDMELCTLTWAAYSIGRIASLVPDMSWLAPCGRLFPRDKLPQHHTKGIDVHSLASIQAHHHLHMQLTVASVCLWQAGA